MSLRRHTGLRISYAMYCTVVLLFYDRLRMVNREIKRCVGWQIMLLYCGCMNHLKRQLWKVEVQSNSWGDVVTGIVRHSVLGRWHSQVQSLRRHTGQDCHCELNPKSASVSNKKVIQTSIDSRFSFRINFPTYKKHD